MMGRTPITEEVGGLKVTCTPMPLPQAEELMPEVIEFVGCVLKEVAKGSAGFQLANLDVEQVGAALIAGGGYLGGGRLQRIAPKIFATVSVALPDIAGVLERKELGKEQDRISVLDARPDVYFPILFFAGRVTFARFFPSGLSALNLGGQAAGAGGRPDAKTQSASS